MLDDPDALTRLEAALERIAQRPAVPTAELTERLDRLITTLRTALDE